jgi:hypothetical protein
VTVTYRSSTNFDISVETLGESKTFDNIFAKLDDHSSLIIDLEGQRYTVNVVPENEKIHVFDHNNGHG